MTDAGGRRLRVVADLEIDVDGTTAQLTSKDDGRLVLSSPRPELLWRAALDSALPSALDDLSGPRGVGRLARGLAEAGVTVEVAGPQGSVVHLGAGVHSRLGRVVTGSEAVRAGAPVAVTRLVWSRIPTPVAVATGAAALVLAITRLRRRANRG